MQGLVEAGAATGESIGDALKFAEEPLIAMSIKSLFPAYADAGLGVDKVVSGADERVEVGGCSPQVLLLIRASKTLHKMQQGIGYLASCTVFEFNHAPWLNSFTAPDRMPLQPCEAVDSQAYGGRVVRAN